MNYTSFKVTIENHIATVAFNRPEKANSLHEPAWLEMQTIFETLHDTPEARVIVLRGEGKHFCAGIDLATLMNIQKFQDITCPARQREALRKFIFKLQDTITAIEKCRKPVLAAIHGACLGGGINIIVGCDMRYATEDAYFSIKEIDYGFAADLGILQRLPKIISSGMAAELAYTGRKFYGAEATSMGLTNRTFESKEAMLEDVMKTAANIASRSPLAVRGTKEMLLYARDHSVDDALNYMASWNAAMLMSNDLTTAFTASMSKQVPEFED